VPEKAPEQPCAADSRRPSPFSQQQTFLNSSMSFKFSAAHSSRIKKPTKPPAFKRNSSSASPYSSLPRRKPLQRTSTKPEKADDEDEVGPNSLGVLIPLIAMSPNFWIISSRMFQERLHNATRKMNTSLLWRTNIHTSTDTTP
jgi:hypothetical protein